jgi:hypothetical protein
MRDVMFPVKYELKHVLFIRNPVFKGSNQMDSIHYSRLEALVYGIYEIITTIVHKQTPWPLVRKRTIPTERQQLVDDI